MKIRENRLWESIKKILSILRGIVKHPLSSGALGAFIATILMIWLSTPPVYISNVTIDQSGANYTSARWEYYIQPNVEDIFKIKTHWVFFDLDVRNIEDNFNLSDYEGIEFYIAGCEEDQRIEFSLFTHSFIDDKHRVYQYWDGGKLLVTTNWKKERILFSNLSIVPWNEYLEAPKKPELDKVFALGFAVHTVKPTKNVIWIDEVYLIHKNGSKVLISNFNTLNTSINGVEGLWHAGWGRL